MKNKLIYIIVAVVVLAVVGGGLFLSKNKATKNETPTPTSSTGTTNSSSSAPSKPKPNAGQVTISGAINKSFTPAMVEAPNAGSIIVLGLYEQKIRGNGVTLQFPVDTQLGTSTFSTSTFNRPDAVVGMYRDLNGVDEIKYSSTKGTLTLTTVGSKFSGQFQFTAVDSNDASKTIEVSGSFTDISIQ